METREQIETRNKKPETSKRREQLMLYAPLVLWIGVIFFLSSSQGSMTETSRIIRPLLEFFFPTATPETLTFYHGVIRKFAHFAEYAVLGLLAARAFARRTTAQAFLTAVALAAVVAFTDEFLQSLNPARTGSAYDVAIDLVGAVFGSAIGIWRIKAQRKRSTESVSVA